MPNLLPQNVRRSLVREYRLRIATIILFISGLVLVFTAFLLIASYIEVSGRVLASELEVESVKQSIAVEGGKAFDQTLRNTREDISLLFTLGTSTTSSKIITDITGKLPRGVTITQFDITQNKGAGTVRLTGNATRRDLLLNFTKNLESISFVSNVDLPISHLTQTVDIDFAIEIQGKF